MHQISKFLFVAVAIQLTELFNVKNVKIYFARNAMMSFTTYLYNKKKGKYSSSSSSSRNPISS